MHNKTRAKPPQPLPEDVVLSVRNVSKKFCRSLRRSMAYGIKDLVLNLAGVRQDTSGIRRDEFWALNDVSFDLRRGETLGLIGINGSGKTTLLRLLTGIYPPDKGEIAIRGRVGALIALGAGFHGHLTGRENIYLNGAIQGMTREEIRRKIGEIIEFSDLGEFIDAPVITYSSGMKVRLGFAVATATSPDLLLIDEVLAVGDLGFQAKCFNAMNKLSKNTAVVFVSHNMPQVARVASRVIVMDHGKAVVNVDDVALGIETYHDSFCVEEKTVAGSGRAVIDEVMLSGADGYRAEGVTVRHLDDLRMRLRFRLATEIAGAFVSAAFFDKSLRIVAQALSQIPRVYFANNGHAIDLEMTVPRLPLAPGTYTLTINFMERTTDGSWGEQLARYGSIASFKVVGPTQCVASYSPVLLDAEWRGDAMKTVEDKSVGKGERNGK